MKDDKSKDGVELLGKFLRDRAPSAQEERSVLDRVWQEMGANELPQQVRREFQSAEIQSFMSRYVWAVGAAAVVIAVVIAGLAVRKSEPVRPGEKLSFGEEIRAGSNSRTVLSLNDGSQIEMRSNSALALEKANDGIRIRLDKVCSLQPRNNAADISMSKRRT
jgi:ferric-dicitrate binding protein FerR (iron transport regulator)